MKALHIFPAQNVCDLVFKAFKNEKISSAKDVDGPLGKKRGFNIHCHTVKIDVYAMSAMLIRPVVSVSYCSTKNTIS